MSVNLIAARIMQSLGMGQKKEGLSREQAFEARPMRNPELKWRVNDEDCVEVVIPRRSDRLGRVMGFVFAVPETKPVILDDVGTFVWGLCDAKHTVADLVQALCDEYNLTEREVEVSLTEYLRILGKRGMVGFAVPEEEDEDEAADDDESADDADESDAES